MPTICQEYCPPLSMTCFVLSENISEGPPSPRSHPWTSMKAIALIASQFNFFLCSIQFLVLPHTRVPNSTAQYTSLQKYQAQSPLPQRLTHYSQELDPGQLPQG